MVIVQTKHWKTFFSLFVHPCHQGTSKYQHSILDGDGKQLLQAFHTNKQQLSLDLYSPHSNQPPLSGND